MRVYEDLLDDIEAKKTDMSAVDADEIKNSPDDYEYIFCFSCLAQEELKNPEYFVDRLSDILSANRFIESFSDIVVVDGTKNDYPHYLYKFCTTIEEHLFIVGIEFSAFRTVDQVFKFLWIPYKFLRNFYGYKVRCVDSSSEEGLSLIFEDYSLVMQLQQQSRNIQRNDYAMRWKLITFCDVLMKEEDSDISKAKVDEFLNFQENWMKKAFVEKMMNCVDTKIYASHLKLGTPGPSRMDCRLTQNKINIEDGVFLFIYKEHKDSFSGLPSIYNLNNDDESTSQFKEFYNEPIEPEHQCIYNKILNHKRTIHYYSYWLADKYKEDGVQFATMIACLSFGVIADNDGNTYNCGLIVVSKDFNPKEKPLDYLFNNLLKS